MMSHTWNPTNEEVETGSSRPIKDKMPQHLGGRDRQISEFEASLVYRVSSRTARATQRNPVLKK